MKEHESDAGRDVNANASADGRDVIGIEGGAASGRAVAVRVPVGTRLAPQVREHPSEESLSALASGFGGFVRDKVERTVAQVGGRDGSLTAEAAEQRGQEVAAR